MGNLVVCLSHLTIDHASLSRRSTVPTLNRDTSNIWALVTILPYTTQKLFAYPVPVLFRRLRSPSISRRIAIVFSLLSILLDTKLLHHIRLSSSSSPLTHPAPPCIFYILLLLYVSPTLYCCATWALICSHVFLLPTTGIYMYFLVKSRSPTRNRSCSFWRCPLDRADTFSFQYLPSIPRIYLSASPLSPHFLALAFPFLLLSYTRQNSL